MASTSIGQLLLKAPAKQSLYQVSPTIVVSCSLAFKTSYTYSTQPCRLVEFSGHHRDLINISRAAPGNSPIADDDEDGVSLGTMKLPLNIDIPRFESLLFQWANSLCQGANLPLPMPMKVDKVPGGARLAFITIGDNANTEVLVYIDCLVFPANNGSGPFFRAIRNGLKKDQPPPGEPRIMRSLMLALQKSAEVARV